MTEQIIGAAIKVHNTLGHGFLEKVYENALAHELHTLGFTVLQQHPIPVHYDGIVVGDYLADLIVEGKVVVELKTARGLADEHTSICINYLHACKLPICLLLNFGTKRLQIKRLVGDSYANEEDIL
jgi:GxxExxY protein